MVVVVETCSSKLAMVETSGGGWVPESMKEVVETYSSNAVEEICGLVVVETCNDKLVQMTV